MFSIHKKKKCVLILLDGLGDRSYTALGNRTPLQAAHTPVLDRLTQNGASGLFHPTRMGQALPSEMAHFALFGYSMKEFPGRGALEALGAGLPIRTEDVAVLARFAKLFTDADGCLRLSDEKVTEEDERLNPLSASVGDYEYRGIRIRFYRTKGPYGILILRGNVSPRITDTDPILLNHRLSAVKPWYKEPPESPAADTAAALKSYLVWAYERLGKHPLNRERIEKGLEPINGIVTQRAGQLRSVPFFRERYGFSGISIASGIIYRGICSYLGLDFHKVKDTDNCGEDIAARLEKAVDFLGRYDFIHVHSERPDQAAHTKDPEAKIRVIEELDAGIGRAIEPLLESPDVVIAVTADHSTPSKGPLVHSGEPVPLIFCGPGIRRDRVEQFNEVDTAGGALGCVRGPEFMDLVLNYMDRAKLQGLMDTPYDQRYWPGDYEPFRIGK